MIERKRIMDYGLWKLNIVCL